MSAAARWAMPDPAPPHATQMRRGGVELPDHHTGVARRRPVPYLQAEVQSWAKPTGPVTFPLHPGGVLELYRLTVGGLQTTGVLDDLTKAERLWLERECWRVSGVVFRAGKSMRAALDDAAESRSLWPSWSSLRRFPPKSRMLAFQLSGVAAWAVFHATCAWSKETQ